MNPTREEMNGDEELFEHVRTSNSAVKNKVSNYETMNL